MKRAEAYLNAGADAIFPEAMETEDEFAEFARRIKAPLLANMTEFGKSPLLTVRRLGEMGYRLVIFPQTAFRIAMKAEEQALRELKERGTQRGSLKRMQTRKELYADCYNMTSLRHEQVGRLGNDRGNERRPIWRSR